MKALAGVEVVIDKVDPGGFQRARLILLHQPERDTQLQLRMLGLDAPRRGGEAVDVGRARSAPAGDHAKAPRTGGDGALRRREQLGNRVEAIARNRSIGDRWL